LSTDDWRCLMISQTGGQRVRQAHHSRAWTEDPLPTLTYITESVPGESGPGSVRLCAQ